MSTPLKFKSSRKSTLNIINRNIFEVDYNWDFNRCLKSVKIDSLKFTNYFANKKDVLLKFVNRELTWLINNQEKVFDRYDIKPVFEKKYFDKIKTISFQTCCMKYGYLNQVARLKHNQNGGFQLYYFIKEKELIFLAIDIYHLIIPADEYILGEKINRDSEIEYEKHKGKNYGLENLNLSNLFFNQY